MTGRDRMVIIGIVVFLLLGGSWVLVVSPERKQAASVVGNVTTASAKLTAAEGKVASGRSALAKYEAAYASIVSLGKAVPPTTEVPSLIYQIEQATHDKHVEFSSITPGTAAPSTTFSQVPFTFVFNGSYLDLYHLLEQLDHFTVRTTSGGLKVSGRLLTIQSIKLNPGAAAGATGKQGAEQMIGNVSATAYVLPATQGLTAGATASAPAGAAASTAPAVTTASSGTTSSPTAPAIARVTP